MFDERQKAKDAAKDAQNLHEGILAGKAHDLADNPLNTSSDGAQEAPRWSHGIDRLQEQRRSKKQVAIGLLGRLAEETGDPCYEECIALLSSVDPRPAAKVFE